MAREGQGYPCCQHEMMMMMMIYYMLQTFSLTLKIFSPSGSPLFYIHFYSFVFIYRVLTFGLCFFYDLSTFASYLMPKTPSKKNSSGTI